MLAIASKYEQMQQMLPNASKCKQMQAIRMETFENQSKLKGTDVKSGPPRVNKPSIWNRINPKWLFEDSIDNIVQRQFVKRIQENTTNFK